MLWAETTFNIDSSGGEGKEVRFHRRQSSSLLISRGVGGITTVLHSGAQTSLLAFNSGVTDVVLPALPAWL